MSISTASLAFAPARRIFVIFAIVLAYKTCTGYTTTLKRDQTNNRPRGYNTDSHWLW